MPPFSTAGRRGRTLALAVAVSLAAAACGGDDGDTTTAATTPAPTSAVSGATTTRSTAATASLPPLTVPKQELKTTTVSYTFANGYTVNGKLTAVDVWWGLPTAGGEKALTVEPGKVSEPVMAKIRASASTIEPLILIMPKGETDPKNLVQQLTENAKEGEKRLVFIGSAERIAGQSSFGGTTTTITLSGGTNVVPPAPAGKALVFSNNSGLRHLGSTKDFVVPGVTGNCFRLDNNLGGGNSGGGHAIDPGSYTLALFDANTQCKTALGGTPTTVAAGDRYFLFAYGETAETRTSLVVKV
jgi:hypothetical protein